MKSLEVSYRIFKVLSIAMTGFLFVIILSNTLADYQIIDLNKAGLFIMMNIVVITQYYQLKIRRLKSKVKPKNDHK